MDDLIMSPEEWRGLSAGIRHRINMLGVERDTLRAKLAAAKAENEKIRNANVELSDILASARRAAEERIGTLRALNIANEEIIRQREADLARMRAVIDLAVELIGPYAMECDCDFHKPYIDFMAKVKELEARHE